MLLRLLWITALCVWVSALGLTLASPRNAAPMQLVLNFEPTLAVFLALAPENRAPARQAPKPNLGRVQFGQGDVCCPGIPARNTVNIATGEVMPLN
tara:strand:+ start:31 stop:318 length:288 start_codon:yes stop_codon:yes gene_type:complete